MTNPSASFRKTFAPCPSQLLIPSPIWATKLIGGFGYDSVGRLASLTRTANGNYTTTINTSYTLDLLDRVTSITHSKGIGEEASLLSQFIYGYDVGGRVTNYTG
ncbi:MAG: hypothetical protein EBT92_18980 [Planctomycetes bacterium]|nr:hypothetical protein [Planctomycetota bacterium]